LSNNTASSNNTEFAFQHAPMTGIRGGPFELIMCSHIVQHIATTSIAPALRHLHTIAAPGGLLVLAFSRAPIGHGGYTLDSDDGGTVRSEPVDRRAFDEAVTSGARTGVLPIRLLDPEEFGQEVAEAGWRADWDWTFHVLEEIGPAGADRDELVNTDPLLRRTAGRDMVTLWRRAR
jgi:SAM-dependent methyltransferase